MAGNIFSFDYGCWISTCDMFALRVTVIEKNRKCKVLFTHGEAGGTDILENIKIYKVKGEKTNTAGDMTENFEITANENGTYDIKFKDADS